MEDHDEVSQYLILSNIYLDAARNNLENGLLEPSMFSAIHSLELLIKSLLMNKIDDPIITHNVGGLFGRYFREELGPDICRKVNSILIRYNFQRYPGNDPMEKHDVEEVINFIVEFKDRINGLLS